MLAHNLGVPYIDDVMSSNLLTTQLLLLQLQYGRIIVSESCMKTFPMAKLSGLSLDSFVKENISKDGENNNEELSAKIQETFTAILENGVLEQRLF